MPKSCHKGYGTIPSRLKSMNKLCIYESAPLRALKKETTFIGGPWSSTDQLHMWYEIRSRQTLLLNEANYNM